MIGNENALDLLRNAIRPAMESQVELLMIARDAGCSRYANSVVHQNVHEEVVSVYVRTLDGGRVGLAKVSSMDRTAIGEGIRRARAAVAWGGEEEGFKAFPSPQPCETVSAFSAETFGYDHRRRVESLDAVFKEAGKRGLRVAGAFTTGVEEVAVVNTNGIEAYQATTVYDVTFTSIGEAASGFAGKTGTEIEDLNVRSLARRSMEKASEAGGTIVLPQGKYTVILEPKALAELLEWTSYIAFGARQYQDETSFMAGKIGKKIAGENITIYDDALEPVGFPRAFDYEGVPKRRCEIIREGKAVGVVYDTLHASREGRESTGHATPPDSDDGPIPMNLAMQGGEETIDEIISSTERAVLVTRFHYVNGLLEPEIALMTGMTRDGTYVVEDGVPTKRVREMRFTDSVLRILDNVTAVSRERESIRSWWTDEGVYTVPYIRVDGVSFTGRTGS